MSETVNNYPNTDFSKNIMDRIYALESNVINIQKAIDNLQYNQSVQSSQTHLIKVRNGIFAKGVAETTGMRRLKT